MPSLKIIGHSGRALASQCEDSGLNPVREEEFLLPVAGENVTGCRYIAHKVLYCFEV